jgi:hypothetical protein
LHDQYKGNPQAGIVTLGQHRAVFAFTGAQGEAYGYQDEWLPDGTYRYYGEGRRGDMILNKGNGAIHAHAQQDVRLFLFDMDSGRDGFVIYKGEFRRVRTGEDRGPDQKGEQRRRFFFDLEPVESEGETKSSPDSDNQDLFDEGRDREIRTNRFERRRAAVKRAKQIHGLSCQICGFNFGAKYGQHGEGFIEVHHLHPVSQAAKSGKKHVDARKELRTVCSNCHRMLHKGARLLSLGELRELIDAAAKQYRPAPSWRGPVCD